MKILLNIVSILLFGATVAFVLHTNDLLEFCYIVIGGVISMFIAQSFGQEIYPTSFAALLMVMGTSVLWYGVYALFTHKPVSPDTFVISIIYFSFSAGILLFRKFRKSRAQSQPRACEED